jgi:plastocyanin
MLRIWSLALLVVVFVAPDAAADGTVEVGDDFFRPSTVQIAPGDRVIWRWSGANPHNVRATAGQGDSFRSSIMRGSGARFEHVFNRAGRFTYYCDVHPTNMRGVVEVSGPPVPDSTSPRLSGLRAHVRRRSVRLSFRLSEAARVRVALTGATRRTVTRRFRKGRRTLVVRRLRRGRQRATLTPTDLAGNRGRSARRRFRVV